MNKKNKISITSDDSLLTVKGSSVVYWEYPVHVVTTNERFSIKFMMDLDGVPEQYHQWAMVEFIEMMEWMGKPKMNPMYLYRSTKEKWKEWWTGKIDRKKEGRLLVFQSMELHFCPDQNLCPAKPELMPPVLYST